MSGAGSQKLLLSMAYGSAPSQCPNPVHFRSRGEFSIRPCGQCWVCSLRKRDERVGRAVAESASGPSVSLCLTLNDAAFLGPEWADQEAHAARWYSKDHWKQEVRRLLDRCTYHWGKRPTYRLVAEAGGDRNRPHCHVLLFGVPAWFVPRNKGRIQWDLWPHGHVHAQECSVGAARYACEYLTNGDKAAKVIWHSASRGLGLAYVRKWLSWMINPTSAGAVCSHWPDRLTGLLDACCIEVNFKRYPMDYWLRQYILGLLYDRFGALRFPGRPILEKRSARLVSALAELEVAKECLEGGPLVAQAKREYEYSRALARKREVDYCKAGRAPPPVFIDGYLHRI